MTNHCAEEPLADWEKELLMPDKDAVVHMYPAEGMTACDTKLDDGRIHLITGNLAGVSCSECRIKTLTYYNEQLQSDLAKKVEELRVSKQAYTSCLREVGNLLRRREEDGRMMRRMREEIEYLRQGGYDDGGHSGYPPVRRPVQNPF